MLDSAWLVTDPVLPPVLFVPCSVCGFRTMALPRTKSVPLHGRVGLRRCTACKARGWYKLSRDGGAFVGGLRQVNRPVPKPVDNALRQLCRAPCRFARCTHLKGSGPYCPAHQQQFRRRGRDATRLTPIDDEHSERCRETWAMHNLPEDE